MKFLRDFKFADCPFVEFRGNKLHEFGFQTLPLGTNFRTSRSSSPAIFHVRYLYVTNRRFDTVLFILLIYYANVMSLLLLLKVAEKKDFYDAICHKEDLG